MEFEVDDICIDTQPAFNIHTLSELIAADARLIPSDCDVISLKEYGITREFGSLYDSLSES